MKRVSQKLWPGAETDGEVNGVLADISFCCDEAHELFETTGLEDLTKPCCSPSNAPGARLSHS